MRKYTDTSNVSHVVGSSQYRAFADDSLKDEDNAAWVMQLEPGCACEWLKRIGWIRLVDRLAENELIEATSYNFQQFRVGWHLLRSQGRVEPGNPYPEVLTDIRDRWFSGYLSRIDYLSIQSWNTYVDAIATYHQPNPIVESLAQYETMLKNLGGSCFQVLPFLSEAHWESAGCWGVVDQFYNNLRDLREDAEQGVCYFPTEILNRFGVSREEILLLRCFTNPGYYQLMQFWLDDYLPQIRKKTFGLLLASELHPSWEILRDWSLHRYSRIERLFRRCQFNFVLFSRFYWSEVKALSLLGAGEQVSR